MQSGPHFSWEYSNHTDLAKVISECIALVTALQADPLSFSPTLTRDSRPVHERMFFAVVPPDKTYFAGNYRGSKYPLLENYEVQFGGVQGRFARMVEPSMQWFHEDMASAHASTTWTINGNASKAEQNQHLLAIAGLAAEALQYFLTIHPYANGNGHIGRFLVWVVLCLGGYPPRKWTLHKSPPGYGMLIQRHRSGEKLPLIKFIVSNV